MDLHLYWRTATYSMSTHTPCDVCLQVLRGHSRQGLRCKLCRKNVHLYCQDKLEKCQSKSKLLSRRQTCATDMVDRLREDANGRESAPLSLLVGENIHPQRRADKHLLRGHSHLQLAGVTAVRPASSGWKRQIALSSKSCSLDLPDESSESLRRVIKSASSSSTGRIHYAAAQSPSSPTYSNHSLLGRVNGNRGSRSDVFYGSVQQSASPKHFKLPHNLYVVLHSFNPRRADDLGLTAGSTVQILDTSDNDWWRGQCPITGSVGYLPSTYLAHLRPGERVHQVSQLCSLDMLGGEVCNLTRDQIVIEMSPEYQDRLDHGKVMVRSGDTSHPLRGIVHARYLCSL